MSLTISVIALAIVTAVYLVACLFQRGESQERRRASLLILPLGAPPMFAKMQIVGDSVVAFVQMLTFAQLGLLVATLGRPARIVDLSFAGTDEERQDQRRRRQIRLTQYAFIGLGAFVVLLYQVAGWTFFE
ncbi:hypothetical protein [Nocardioides sp. AN3]